MNDYKPLRDQLKAIVEEQGFILPSEMHSALSIIDSLEAQLAKAEKCLNVIASNSDCENAVCGLAAKGYFAAKEGNPRRTANE
jgi:hypothetical protein